MQRELHLGYHFLPAFGGWVCFGPKESVRNGLNEPCFADVSNCGNPNTSVTDLRAFVNLSRTFLARAARLSMRARGGGGQHGAAHFFGRSVFDEVAVCALSEHGAHQRGVVVHGNDDHAHTRKLSA